MKTRFVIAGAGNRGLGCFAKGLLGWPTKGRPAFPQRADLVTLVDTNQSRAQACAAEAIADAAWGLWLSNPAQADGKAFFHADHGNYAEGADTPLSVDGPDRSGGRHH